MAIRKDLSTALMCIGMNAAGDRCRGHVHADDETPDTLSCATCGATYDCVRDVPLMRTILDEDLDDQLDGAVYHQKSRTRSLNGEDHYMRQSALFRDYLPDFCERHGVTGPSLEVGCGLGIFADRVPDHVGLDYSMSALQAEGFEDYRKVCASGDLLPFQDESFGLLFSLNTYEHVPNLNRAFSEMDRVMKKGGYVVLKPAWNCMQYNCDGVGYFASRDLSMKNRLIKLMLPVLRSKPYKAAARIPHRLWNHLMVKDGGDLVHRDLKPRFDLFMKVADAEAFSSVDPYFAMRFLSDRGYEILSHPSWLSRVKAGHDIVVARKPGA